MTEGGPKPAPPAPALGAPHTPPAAGCWAGRWLALFTCALSLPSPIREQGARPVPVPISTRCGGGRVEGLLSGDELRLGHVEQIEYSQERSYEAALAPGSSLPPLKFSSVVKGWDRGAPAF